MERNDDEGNVIGEWLILPARFAIVRILFSAKHGFQPTQVRYFHQQDDKPAREWFGSSTISWQRTRSAGWGPTRIRMEAKHPDSFTAYRGFELDWLDHVLIGKERFSFDLLVTKEPYNWRAVFLDLFSRNGPRIGKGGNGLSAHVATQRRIRSAARQLRVA